VITTGTFGNHFGESNKMVDLRAAISEVKKDE